MADESYPENREIVTRDAALEQGLKRYFTGRPCGRGHLAERTVSSRNCVDCIDREKACLAAKAYRDRHPEYVKRHNDKRSKEALREIGRRYYEANKTELQAEARARRKIAYWKNPAAEVARAVQYRADNLDKVNERLRRWARERRVKDRQFSIATTLRARVTTAIRASAQGAKAGSAVRDMGCTVSRLVAHLEKMFSPGMSWDNYGTVWHVDHILPLAGFDLTDPDQFKTACHFTNLRPLLAGENMKKGGRRTLLL